MTVTLEDVRAAEPIARPAPARKPVIYTASTGARFTDRGTALLVRLGDQLFDTIKTAKAQLAAKISSVELQLAEVRGAIEALRGLRGEAGPAGVRGPRGPAGPQGAPGPIVAGWDIDEQRFIVTPVGPNGERGAPLHLRSLLAALARELAQER